MYDNSGESFEKEFNPSYSEICFQIIRNQFEPIRKSFCISYDENRSKLIRLHSIHSAPILSIDLNESEKVFNQILSE